MSAISDVVDVNNFDSQPVEESKDTMPAVEEKKLDLTGVMHSYAKTVAKYTKIDKEETKIDYLTYEKKTDSIGATTEA